MSTYIIGDIHGCYRELKFLLKKINFDVQHDVLWITGDLVFRGKDSLSVLRFLYSIRKNIKLVLGNNDLNLIKIFLGLQKNDKKFNIDNLLKAFDRDKLIFWLLKQPLLHIDIKKKILLVHAGIFPFWTFKEIIYYHEMIHSRLKSADFFSFLSESLKYNVKYFSWKLAFNSKKYIFFILNVFTKMRYISLNGDLNFSRIYNHDEAKSMDLYPWFNIYNRITAINKFTIIFGHWSTIRGRGTPRNIIGLDTGCCWHGCLTALCWDNKKIYSQNCF
ncbi:symmetrical bis(5'-nucleosyl)-tetraphosphatase [Buchnera aphidicola]|uniref:symmetrical bis(5'-nucleosyl)-tetraphosphatase n=1 Tax=Buchnera aphidicola TaxID=9 RepID=UPI00094CBF4C|nr:symmetrical bis(5'-nucleosyl)-tetraphosphatase [Buchnera aphidicola]